MAKKSISEPKPEAPAKLTRQTFYGIDCDEEQAALRDAIWGTDYDVIFVDSVAGTGKTLISVATANLLVQYGRYEGIVYVVSPTGEERLGYLPGSADEKISPYSAPLYDALAKIGVNHYNSINQNTILNQKNGTGYIDCLSHVYLRGCNFSKRVIIIDEAQNLYKDELRKVLTRISDDCKVIVIGHTGQCDLYKNPQNSGFEPYINHFKSQPRAMVCALHTNHRGWISSWADADL